MSTRCNDPATAMLEFTSHILTHTHNSRMNHCTRSFIYWMEDQWQSKAYQRLKLQYELVRDKRINGKLIWIRSLSIVVIVRRMNGCRSTMYTSPNIARVVQFQEKCFNGSGTILFSFYFLRPYSLMSHPITERIDVGSFVWFHQR